MNNNSLMNDSQIESAIDEVLSEATTNQKVKLLQKLADAMYKLAPDYGEPTVSTNLDRPGQAVLAWDGPYEWILISMGQSLFAGEAGNYGKEIEPDLKAVIDEIESKGLFLEPINNVWMGIHEA
jgi:hypothetical protein